MAGINGTIRRTSDDRKVSDKITEKRTGKPPKKHRFSKFIAWIAVILIAVVSIIVTLNIQSEVADREKQYEQIEAQIKELQVQNNELTLTLNSDDIESYMEKLAIEKYGYAYPDEVRFYDKSHN